MSNARLSVKSKASRGEIVSVRLVIQHPMETGFRVDVDGRVIAKNVINQLICRYGGREVWRAELSSGMTANPYFEFFIRADMSADLEFTWQDDAGEKGSVQSRIEVA